MPNTSRISPCYPYRYQKEGETDAQYAERCAAELEAEIIRVGEKRVAAFFVETGEPVRRFMRKTHVQSSLVLQSLVLLRGTSLLFRATSRPCDVSVTSTAFSWCWTRSCVAWGEAESYTAGIGKVSLESARDGHRRTKLRPYTGVVPDIQTIGKGLNGGYQALSAVLMSERVVTGLRSGSGCFANGQTFQCHPAAAAAGLAVMSIFESEAIVQNCAKRGAEVSGASYTSRSHLPQSPGHQLMSDPVASCS